MPPTLPRDLSRVTNHDHAREHPPLAVELETPRRPGGRRAGASAAAVAVAVAGLLAASSAAVAAPVSLLTQGSRGSDVARVQRALHQRATGRYGARTRRAVLAFQHRDGLMVDGIVGVQTWDALFHIPAPVTPTTSTTAAPRTQTGGGYTVPSSIVQCESGGNYSAVNPSTGAGGAYQILPSTWSAYGGQGLPQDASPAQQGQIAAEIYAHQGPSAWTC
jgi:peptidoglycan hydrolase-like protein with peptidoglycan-binding domain